MRFRTTHTYEVDLPDERAAEHKAHDVSSLIEASGDGVHIVSARVRSVPSAESVLDRIEYIIHDVADQRMSANEKCDFIATTVLRLTDPARG